MTALKIVGRAAVAFYEELFFYFILGLVHVFSWLLIVPGPFVLVGIYTIGQRAVRGFGVKWAIIWDGIKEFGLRSLLLFFITVFGYGVVVSNLWFYNSGNAPDFVAPLAPWMTPLFVALGLLWTGMTFYAQAFLMELEEPRMLVVLRNSLYLTILKPVQTLFFVVVTVIALALSVGLPILLIVSPGFISALTLTAVRTLVTDLAEKVEAMEEEEPGDVDQDEDGAVPDTDLPGDDE
jgi:hypothetical protein